MRNVVEKLILGNGIMAPNPKLKQTFKELYNLSAGARLKCRGASDFEEAPRKWMQAFPGISPKTFYEGLSAGFEKVRTEVELGEIFEDTGDVIIRVKTPGSDGIELEIEKKKRGEKGRDLNLKGVFLERKAQGGPLAPLLVRNLVHLAEPMGIATVSGTAIGIGSYAAAKYGIPASGEDQQWRDRARRRLDLVRGELPQGRADEVEALLRSDDPSAINRVAEMADKVTLSHALDDRIQADYKGNPSDNNLYIKESRDDNISLGKALLLGNIWSFKMTIDQLKEKASQLFNGPVPPKPGTPGTPGRGGRA